MSVDSIGAGTEVKVPGPSATGVDRARFWKLLWLTSKTEFRLRYHGSLLGYAWTLLQPLLLFGVIYVFFSQVIRFGATVENYASLLLFNIMLIMFFSQSTSASVTSLVSRERMLRTTDFPRMVIPMSVILTGAFGLLVGLPIAFLFFFVNGVEPLWTWIFLPVIVVLLFLLALGVALILSTLYVTLRDVSQIWTAVARALFYSSPVVYPIERVPEALLNLVYVNPLAPILTQARAWIVDPSAPNAVEAAGSFGIYPAIASMVLILALGFWLFIRRASRIAELL